MDPPFHEMVVIDEPFRRGRDRTSVIDRLYGGTIRVEQNGSIFGETCRQKAPLTRSRRHNLRDRKTASMVLEALNAKKFFANGFSAIPRRRKTYAFKGASQENSQFDLSAARISSCDNAEGISVNPKRLYDRAGNGRSPSSIGQRRVICPMQRARTACAEHRWADHSIR